MSRWGLCLLAGSTRCPGLARVGDRSLSGTGGRAGGIMAGSPHWFPHCTQGEDSGFTSGATGVGGVRGSDWSFWGILQGQVL